MKMGDASYFSPNFLVWVDELAWVSVKGSFLSDFVK